jgi:hypothetical protein
MLHTFITLVQNKLVAPTRVASIGLCATISTVALSQTAAVQIRVLNGHNGKPIAHEGIFVRFEPIVPHSIENAPSTDADGTLKVNAPVHAGMNATVNYYPTCRHVPKANRTKGPITFPVEQVVATGVVEKNNCSHLIVPPTPGELTLFVRPLHWWERLSD